MSKLIKAAYKGKLDKVISLLEEGVEIAATDEVGNVARVSSSFKRSYNIVIRKEDKLSTLQPPTASLMS
jgi:hypothetical protein